MNDLKFKTVKYISVSCVIGIYFFITYYIMEKWQQEGMIKFSVSVEDLVIVCILYCAALFLLLILLEALRIGQRRILDLIFGFFFASFLTNLVSGLTCRVFTLLTLGRLCFTFFAVTLLECVIGFAWIMGCHQVYRRSHFRKEAIFIYGNREDEGEYVRVNNTINRYFTISRSIDYQVGIERLLNEIRESSVVFIGDIPVEIRNVILKFCLSRKIECFNIPKISDIYIQSASILQLNDKLLLKYPGIGIAESRKALKRLMDIILSLLMLVLASPIMLAIAILIKKEDGGDIFYRQKRVTLNGKVFEMYKFRSMRSDAEKEGARLACKDDDRVTRVGRVIRNLHFDEFPQLINILRGEMSLVGPRPERQEFIDAYAGSIPEFPERLKVKAGLTGYAQVYGKYNTVPEDKIKYDLYYIYNYSLLLDLKLLILTVRILFQKENTEGVDAGQVSAMKEQDLERKDTKENEAGDNRVCRNTGL